jgi:hypothetical protein
MRKPLIPMNYGEKQMNLLASNQMTVTQMESDIQASAFPMKDLIIRGVISGVVLAMSASRVGAPISDESIVPISIAILMMFCLELAMGVFSVMAKRTNIKGMFRNLLWVGAGNISDKMIGMDNLKLLVHTAHQSLDYIPNLMQCLMST